MTEARWLAFPNKGRRWRAVVTHRTAIKQHNVSSWAKAKRGPAAAHALRPHAKETCSTTRGENLEADPSCPPRRHAAGPGTTSPWSARPSSSLRDACTRPCVMCVVWKGLMSAEERQQGKLPSPTSSPPPPPSSSCLTNPHSHYHKTPTNTLDSETALPFCAHQPQPLKPWAEKVALDQDDASKRGKGVGTSLLERCLS